MSDVTVAVSEKTFKDLFSAVRDNFTFSKSDTKNFGPFSAWYSIAMHLEDGSIDLQNGNKVDVSGLEVKWDQFKAGVGFDIPEICVGGWCIIWVPIAGCVLRLPKICAFSANPDIAIDLDLSGHVTSKISVVASPVTKYRVDPARTPVMSDLDAEDAGIPNQWQVFIDPDTVNLDLFDVAEVVGALLEQAVDDAIDGLLWFLPGWARDLVKALLGPVIDLIEGILGIAGDIADWLKNLLGLSMGLFDLLVTAVADYFAGQYPIVKLEDPYPILPASSGLIPVKIPVRDLAVSINTDEMTIQANVGA